MQIVNRILKDKSTLTYTYTCVCKHCGFKKEIVIPRKNEIEIAQTPCDLCEKPIPQVVMPEPVVIKKIQTPVKKVKPHKKNRKK